jgi:hypothetical protein
MAESRKSSKGDFSPSIFEEAITKEGKLYKKSSGMIKRYQERYFTLQGHYLKYYADSNKIQKDLKGTIDLNETVAPHIRIDGLEFEVVLKDKQTAKLKADTQEDADDWVTICMSRLPEPLKSGQLEGEKTDEPEEEGKKQRAGDGIVSADIDGDGEDGETGPHIAVSVSKVDGSMLELAFPKRKNPTVSSVSSEIERREGCSRSSQELYFMGDDSERKLAHIMSLAQIMAGAQPPVEMLEFLLLINPVNDVSLSFHRLFALTLFHASFASFLNYLVHAPSNLQTHSHCGCCPLLQPYPSTRF